MPANAVDAVVRLVFRPEFSLSPRTGARTSYTRTWRQVNTELSKERDFGRYVQAAAKEYRKVREAVSGEAGGSVARQLYAYVRDNYAWNGVQVACASGRVADSFGAGRAAVPTSTCSWRGCCVLRGTDAVPVLLRVRGSGSVEREAPSKDAFNDVVIRVTDEEGVHFLDASERFAGFGELPARCADMEGLVAEPDTEEWVMLSQEQVAFDGREVGIVVDTAGIADVSVVRTFDGAAAMNLRSGCGGSVDALARMVAGEEGHPPPGRRRATNPGSRSWYGMFVRRRWSGKRTGHCALPPSGRSSQGTIRSDRRPSGTFRSISFSDPWMSIGCVSQFHRGTG